MSDVPRRAVYAVDTNVLMEWQARYYPTDIFVALTARVDELIKESRVFAPKLVRDELGAVGGGTHRVVAEQDCGPIATAPEWARTPALPGRGRAEWPLLRNGRQSLPG